VKNTVFAVLTLLALFDSPRLLAQDRPFVFSVTTAPETGRPQLLVDYDFGAGEHTFQSDAENGPEQRVGLQASLGRWTLLGRVRGQPGCGRSRHDGRMGQACVRRGDGRARNDC